jgi:hypothetical protein
MAVAKARATYSAVGVVDALHPLGHALGAGAEEAVVLEFLEGLAIALVAGDVAHEQHHRRGVLIRGVHADRSVGRARAARDEAHAGAAFDLAGGFRHEGRAAFLPVDHEADLLAVLVEAVEHGEVALAGNAEGVGDALRHQALDDEVTRQLRGCVHDLTRLTGW